MKWQAVAAGLAGGVLLWTATSGVRAGNNSMQQTIAYTSVEYFDAPNAMQIRSRLTSAEVLPLPGTQQVMFKQFKLETFATNGALKYIVEAPNCRYDQLKGIANSSGHLKVRSADGRVIHEGDGFLWQQDDKSLTISNHVHTVIQSGLEIKSTP